MFANGVGIGLFSSVAAAVAGASTTTWDTANSSTSYTYSNGNKTATYSTGTGDQIVRATSGHSGTGDWSYTIQPTSAVGGSTFVGLTALPISPISDFLGDQSNELGWQASSGTLFKGGASVGTPGSYAINDVLTIEIKNNFLYLKKNGTNVLGDPAAQTGGLDVTALGTLYPAASSGGTQTYVGDFTNWP